MKAHIIHNSSVAGNPSSGVQPCGLHNATVCRASRTRSLLHKRFRLVFSLRPRFNLSYFSHFLLFSLQTTTFCKRPTFFWPLFVSGCRSSIEFLGRETTMCTETAVFVWPSQRGCWEIKTFLWRASQIYFFLLWRVWSVFFFCGERVGTEMEWFLKSMLSASDTLKHWR